MLASVIYYLFICYSNEWGKMQICHPNIIFKTVSSPKLERMMLLKTKRQGQEDVVCTVFKKMNFIFLTECHVCVRVQIWFVAWKWHVARLWSPPPKEGELVVDGAAASFLHASTGREAAGEARAICAQAAIIHWNPEPDSCRSRAIDTASCRWLLNAAEVMGPDGSEQTGGNSDWHSDSLCRHVTAEQNTAVS